MVSDVYLHAEECNGSEEVHSRLEIHQFLLRRGREIIAVHGEVDAQRVVQLIQELDEFLFLSKVRKSDLVSLCLATARNNHNKQCRHGVRKLSRMYAHEMQHHPRSGWHDL